MESRRWEPGSHVVLRAVLNGRVLSAQPHVVVRDAPDVTVLWLPPGTVWMKPTGREEAVKKRLNGDWKVLRDIWNGEGLLRLSEPGRPYSVLVFWEPGMRAVAGWYINMEDPLRRTELGFDFLDQLLDVRVTGDRQSWRWKDEDEFEEAVEVGLIDRPRATSYGWRPRKRSNGCGFHAHRTRTSGEPGVLRPGGRFRNYRTVGR